MCKYSVVKCPNSVYGCPSKVSQVDIEEHMNTKCQFKPIQCNWCGKNVLDTKVCICL